MNLEEFVRVNPWAFDDVVPNSLATRGEIHALPQGGLAGIPRLALSSDGV
jgi:hypothetical protein